MDTSNWRPTEGGSGDSYMESSDWRAQLQADSRKKMVNRIMDALKSHVQVSGYEGRQEVEKIAVSFEENVYVAATSQSEYTRKICFKILTIETRSQNPNTSYPAIVDWRLPADSRQRIVNKIMDTLKRHLSFSGPESLQEVKKIAVRFEDKVYSAATSQSDYLRTLSLKMLKVETIYLKNPLADTNRAINPSYPDSTTGEEWQEEVYEKIKALKDLYLLDLNDMHQKIVRKLQQHGALPQQLPNERIEKLKIFKNMLERFMAFLQISKHNILPIFKEKLSTYEKQIVIIATSNRQKLHQPPPQ